MKQLLIAGLGLGLFGGIVATTAVADSHEGATGIVAVRHGAMSAFGGHTSAIKAIIQDTPEQISLIPVYARSIAESATQVPDLFPEGSTSEQSDALPVIWERWDEFTAISEDLNRLAGELATVAENGGSQQEVMAAFATMGKEGCGSCHDTFRAEDD